MHASRKSATVDPAYANFWGKPRFMKQLEQGGVLVFPKTLSEFINEMKQHGWKTRHFNIDMPDTGDVVGEYFLKKFFRELPNILLPNGKVYVSSELPGTLEEIAQEAQKHGLKVRQLPNLTEKNEKRLTEFMQTHGSLFAGDQFRIYRIEITYGLRKAIPNKEKRRTWPKD